MPPDLLVTALSAAAAVLLAVAGIAKLRTPAPAATMLVGLSARFRPVRRARTIARAVGLIEVSSALVALVLGGRVGAALLGACYLVLTVVAIRLVLAPQPTPCGCFGAADGDVGVAHVVLDGCALAIAALAVVRPVGGIATALGTGTLSAYTAAAQAALLAALGYLSITALPALSAARRTLEKS